MSARFTMEQVANLSERNQREVAAAMAPRGLAKAASVAQPGVIAPTVAESPAFSKGKPRLRQSTRGPNKLESRFQAMMKARGHDLLFEAITLKLANGVRYTPDFSETTRDEVGGLVCLTFYETKGPQFEDDARVKLKVAASLFPAFAFNLVTLDKTKPAPWVIERILP